MVMTWTLTPGAESNRAEKDHPGPVQCVGDGLVMVLQVIVMVLFEMLGRALEELLTVFVLVGMGASWNELLANELEHRLSLPSGKYGSPLGR
jgi:hypothetical protein